MAHDQGKNVGGCGQPEGEDHKSIKFPSPLESEVRKRQWVHIHVMVGSQNVYGSAKAGGVEQGSSLALQGFHLKFGDCEIFVHMAPIPDEVQLADTIDGHP